MARPESAIRRDLRVLRRLLPGSDLPHRHEPCRRHLSPRAHLWEYWLDFKLWSGWRCCVPSHHGGDRVKHEHCKPAAAVSVVLIMRVDLPSHLLICPSS